MTEFFICKTCDLVIAGQVACTKHREHKHAVEEIKSLDELRAHGIARDPNNQTSSANKVEPINIAGIRKFIVYIGKGGREVSSRRDGSRVAVKYEYVDELSGAVTQITEQEYYKALFASGNVSIDMFHTFNSIQQGATYLCDALLRNGYRVAIVTNDPDDSNNLIFSQDFSSGIRGNELTHLYAQFYTGSHNAYKTNLDANKQQWMYSLRGSEDVIYYDLLAPRSVGNGAPYLTRVLMTVHHTEAFIKKYSLNKTKQFILYELAESEVEALDSRTSFDWATAIVQDARYILCSQS